jgi:aspartyl-tRNA(Asn)/glutamyl-tRNA(Gln) amidotransferase subunit B
MRNKANAIDYKYFTEPNIVEIDIKTLVKNTVNDVKLDPEHIQHDLEQAGVNIKIINNLLDNNELYNYFIYVYEKTNDLQGTIT